MFRIYLKEFMLQRGISFKSGIQFLRKMGFRYDRARNLYQGNITQLRLDELFLLCQYLQCTPYELIKYAPTPKDNLAEKHPIWAWQQPETDSHPAEIIKILPPEKLEEAKKFLKGLME